MTLLHGSARRTPKGVRRGANVPRVNALPKESAILLLQVMERRGAKGVSISVVVGDGETRCQRSRNWFF
jgi:hypothetical protein